MRALSKNNITISREDGPVMTQESRLLFSDFKTEKEMVSFICDNIEKFTEQYLDDTLISFNVDKNINQAVKLQPRGRRIDIFIKGVKYDYIIETKNCQNGTQIRAGIGQLLDYGREFSNTNKKMVLISNLFDINTAKTIEHYNLPITYIIFNKRYGLTYDKSN